MKSEILWRIGDICDWEDERVVVTGSSVNSDFVEVRSKDDEEYKVHESSLQPLPIDEKLLIASGFAKKPRMCYYVRERARTIRLWNSRNSFVWDVNVDGMDVAKVRYAHELKRIIEALKV